MNNLFKLRKKPSSDTGFKYLYWIKENTWNYKGIYLTEQQLISVIRKHCQDLTALEELPEDWEIVEFKMSELRTVTPKLFFNQKSKKPLIKGV